MINTHKMEVDNCSFSTEPKWWIKYVRKMKRPAKLMLCFAFAGQGDEPRIVCRETPHYCWTSLAYETPMDNIRKDLNSWK